MDLSLLSKDYSSISSRIKELLQFEKNFLVLSEIVSLCEKDIYLSFCIIKRANKFCPSREVGSIVQALLILPEEAFVEILEDLNEFMDRRTKEDKIINFYFIHAAEIAKKIFKKLGNNRLEDFAFLVVALSKYKDDILNDISNSFPGYMVSIIRNIANLELESKKPSKTIAAVANIAGLIASYQLCLDKDEWKKYLIPFNPKSIEILRDFIPNYSQEEIDKDPESFILEKSGFCCN